MKKLALKVFKGSASQHHCPGNPACTLLYFNKTLHTSHLIICFPTRALSIMRYNSKCGCKVICTNERKPEYLSTREILKTNKSKWISNHTTTLITSSEHEDNSLAMLNSKVPWHKRLQIPKCALTYKICACVHKFETYYWLAFTIFSKIYIFWNVFQMYYF